MGPRVYVGKVSELEDGEIVTVTAAGQQVAVALVGEEVFALKDQCTHRECPLSEGVIEEKTVICPCHGSEFDLETGEVLSLPAKEPVARFKAIVDSGEVYVEI